MKSCGTITSVVFVWSGIRKEECLSLTIDGLIAEYKVARHKLDGPSKRAKGDDGHKSVGQVQ